MRLIYPCRLKPDATSIIASFRDVPEAITFGADEADALDSAADALAVALLGRMKDGEPIPPPSHAGKAERLVALEAAAAAKLALYMAWREAGLSKTAFAARLGVAETEARRMLDPYHATKIDRIDAALHALGKRLVVSVEAA